VGQTRPGVRLAFAVVCLHTCRVGRCKCFHLQNVRRKGGGRRSRGRRTHHGRVERSPPRDECGSSRGQLLRCCGCALTGGRFAVLGGAFPAPLVVLHFVRGENVVHRHSAPTPASMSGLMFSIRSLMRYSASYSFAHAQNVHVRGSGGNQGPSDVTITPHTRHDALTFFSLAFD
jgi:hypothetical protein